MRTTGADRIDRGTAARGRADLLSPETFARALAHQGLRVAPRKALISLRIDSDVIDWFRSQGDGWQSRMNALLRAYMEAHV